MPRSARQKSNTGIYHVMLRGINKQDIFYNDEDYEFFLEIVNKYKIICNFTIYAYCLMSNHIHLLIREGEEGLEKVFKRIGASYVHWYNWKYGRVGHLFQDRYKSEVVESDKYFLTVTRYIHQNPLKAGIVNDLSKYRWSSFCEYTGKVYICNIDFGLKYFSSDLSKAIQLFVEFNKTRTDDVCLDDIQVRIHDIEAIKIIKEISNRNNLDDIKYLEREKRNLIIRKLRNKGLSIRQLERLLGIGFNIIRAAK